MNALSFLLLGTPDRVRISVAAFYIIAAIVTMLAIRVKPYRRTILTLAVVLVVFYAQALAGRISPYLQSDATPPDGDILARTRGNIAQLQDTFTWVSLFVGPAAVIAVFMSDRAADRLRKIVASKRDGPWTR